MPLDSRAEVVILNDNTVFNGGASNVALQSAIALATCGTKVTLFTSVGPIAPQIQNRTNLDVVCMQQHEIIDDPNRLRSFVQGIWNRKAMHELDNLLAAKDPTRTIIHVHMWMKALSPGAIAVALKRGFRVVLTLHDFFAVCPSGTFYVHRKRTVCERKPLSASCLTCNCDRRAYVHKLWRFARTAVQNNWFKIATRIHHYIGVSQFSVDVIRRYLPIKVPVTVVRNPVDCQDAGPAKVGENNAFIFVGRFVPEKGADVFADAAHSAKVPALFVGGGVLESDLRRRCPTGEFTGWLPAQQVTALLRRARALVFPSLWYETLGLSAIEAMANGVPVIISDRSAPSDFVKHEHSGLHFQTGSVESLVRQMRRLGTSSFAASLGQNAYNWYWKNPWTTAAHVEELLSVYQRVLRTAP
ncbi:MAG TPA: glycosyltransferase family 4 protein [Terrimicrobiaceae bacterium]